MKEKNEEDKEKIAAEVIAEKQREAQLNALKQREQYLNDIFSSNIDDLVKKYTGTPDFPLILEIKKVEYLETIAYELSQNSMDKVIKSK